MHRDIQADLLRWKNQDRRSPLLLRGARQVGKTFIVQKFGNEEFDNFCHLNFEQKPEYKNCFNTLEPTKILNSIELLTQQSIQAGKTLLFLDEIQECPQAIMALRYFKEEMPDLHIIGAGSLLEFALNDEDFKMPVGRVQFMYLRPLSFGEYLEASGNLKLRDFLKNLHIKDSMQDVIHQKLLYLVREYLALGGMPAVISEYLQSKNLLRCQEIQTDLLRTFRLDFGKYAKKLPHEHLQTVFAKSPGLIGEWLKYSTLDPDTSSATLKKALKKLCDAGLIILVYTTSGSGLPFETHMNEKKFKLLFLDTGLVKRACNLELDLLFNQDLFLINKGALAEQFVGQELLAYMAKEENNILFSWAREEKSSSAEIDFLIAVGSKIVPIEVKAKSIGSLRSLKIFLSEKKIRLGVRISENPLSLSDDILSIPFYMIEELPRLVKEGYGKIN
ncbi:MAG: ATP-binding protein [Chlamydiae bacterium]|nr:ATP-binding protein [Chlamydiota bacterium]